MKFFTRGSYVCVGLAIILFVLTGNVFAQQRQAPSVEEIVAKIKQDLSLTDDQANKITPIVRNQIQQMTSIIEQAQEKVRNQLQALEQITETKLSQILTPEQMDQFKNRQQGGEQQPPQKKNGEANPIDKAVSGTKK